MNYKAINMDEEKARRDELVHLVRFALQGKREDAIVFVRRLARRYRDTTPEFAEQLSGMLREHARSVSPLKSSTMESIPVDSDSRLQLLRPEYPVRLDVEPIWEENVRKALEQLVAEREEHAQVRLQDAGLHPTKSIIFTGPPGVGKTLAARWIARALDRPLLVLDLSAVMSSFLGRTGTNVRNVLDYARGLDCVLLLDEFDSIAKRRDDPIELGELKRLVTVLLQEIDSWPATGLLVAATNHKDLLDPAVWRRFDVVMDFPMPSEELVRSAVQQQFGEGDKIGEWIEVLARILDGLSFADISRELQRMRREVVIGAQPLEDGLKRLVQDRHKSLKPAARTELALQLMKRGLSQREAHDWTRASRDTIRKAMLERKN